jgi:hypothetical protein
MPLANTIGEQSLGKKNCTFLQRIHEGDFPLGSLPEDMVKLCRHYHEFYNIPYAMTAMTAFTLFSAAIGPMVQVVGGLGHRPTALNIWATIVAPQGSGKSLLANELSSEFKRANAAAFARLKRNRRRAEIEIRRLEFALKDRENIGNPQFAEDAKRRIENLQSIKCPSFLTGSCTPEAFKKALAENPDHFVFQLSTEGKEELSIMLGQKYSDSGCSNLNAWLAAKTGDFLSDTRIGRETVTVSGGLNALLLMVQKTVFNGIINQETLDRGLFTRMFIFNPHIKRAFDDGREKPEAPKNFFDEKLRHFLSLRLQLTEPDLSGKTGDEEIWARILANVKKIGCTTGARAAFRSLFNEGLELENEILALGLEVEGITSRWREDAIQIAGILATLENRSVIDQEIAERACALVRWYKKSFLRSIIYKTTVQEERFEKFFNILESTPHGKISRRDLLHSHGIKRKTVDALLILFPTPFAKFIALGL